MLFSFLIVILAINLPASPGRGAALTSPTPFFPQVFPLCPSSILRPLYTAICFFPDSRQPFQFLRTTSDSSTCSLSSPLPSFYISNILSTSFSSPDPMPGILCSDITFKSLPRFPPSQTFVLCFSALAPSWDLYLESQLSLLFCQLENSSRDPPENAHALRIGTAPHLTFDVHFFS